MKRNTENTKSFLQKALQQTPDDFALSEVRYHIRAALSKLETVEKKRESREINAQKRRDVIHPGVYDPMKMIEIIDMMIDEEKSKIENIQKRRMQEKGEDGDTLYG